MKKFIKIENKQSQYQEIKIEAMYRKGGFNPYTFSTEKRGVYVVCSPCKRVVCHASGGDFTSICVMKDSEKTYLVEEMKKMNQKKVNPLIESIMQHAEEIAEAYLEGMVLDINKLLNI